MYKTVESCAVQRSNLIQLKLEESIFVLSFQVFKSGEIRHDY